MLKLISPAILIAVLVASSCGNSNEPPEPAEITSLAPATQDIGDSYLNLPLYEMYAFTTLERLATYLHNGYTTEIDSLFFTSTGDFRVMADEKIELFGNEFFHHLGFTLLSSTVNAETAQFAIRMTHADIYHESFTLGETLIIEADLMVELSYQNETWLIIDPYYDFRFALLGMIF